MKSARHLVGRSLIWLVIGAAVFVGVLTTLPVPPAAEGPDQGVPDETFAIVDVTAFDGETFRQGWDVWVEDGRIRHAGQRLDLPDDLPRLDGRGHTLIPGLVDGHVHSFPSTLSDALRFGVTTVLDQSTDPAFAAAMRPAREEVGRGTEADLFSAGMTATAPEGHGTQYGIPVEPLTGPAAAAEWVRARKAEGSDWIKIIYEDGSAFDMEIPSLDGETVAAVIEAAHAEGLAAVVHVSTLETALEAMAYGADGLVHVWRDEIVSEADARRFAEADIFVVPTLSVMVPAEDSSVAELVSETDEAMLSPIQRQTLAARFPGGLAEGGDVAMENVRRLRAAGVRLVAGTDSPNPGTGTGISMHGELRLLARAGMASTEALAAATSVAADAFGVAERGRIAEGHLADMVLVRGDLEEDVSRSHDIVAIWKDGYLVDRAVGPAGAGPRAEIAPAPAETLVADFENGFEASFGEWDVTTDQLTGGSSSANAAVRDGALVVTGEIAPGPAFPWAGVIWMPGEQPMQPVDFSGREAIRFQTRGDGRQYSVMLLSSAQPAGPPPTVTFVASEEWARVEIRLEDFPTATPEIIAGLAFVAEGPVGGFAFEVDEVEVSSGGLTLAAPPTGAAGQLSFDRVDAVVGSPTTAIQARDLNGDGRLDLVVSGGQSVFVLTGQGDGRFEVTWSGAAGENPVDLAIADLDEDGLADLAVANHETDYVTLLFGTAGGAFERRDHSIFRVDVSPHPHAVRLHDVDSDGHADLLVDDRSPESIRLFRGRGDGTFSGATSIDVGGDPYRGMSLADVTGDGLADLITPNPDHVAILVAEEDGRFRPQTTLPASFEPFSVVAADINGDGRRDVATASGEGAGSLATWHGLADGSFRAAGRYEIASGPTKSAAADLNGDGSAEVLVASYVGGEVAVLIGGDMPLLQRIEIAGSPYGLATGDFDGDGRVDFAVANDGVDWVSVFLTR